MMIKKLLLTSVLILALTGSAWAAISAQEAAQLDGQTLTIVGAEKAGSKDGFIPAYTGGITKCAGGWCYEGKLVVPSAQFNPKSGKRPDPFANDKPIFTVTAQNMAQYSNMLSDGLKAVMTKYPNDVRLNVYPSRRVFSYPETVYDLQKKVAQTAKLEKNGEKLVGARAAFPFPIPKTGLELYWNHHVAFRTGKLLEQYIYKSWLVTAAGRPVMTNQSNGHIEAPYWDPSSKEEIIWKDLDEVTGPPNRAGEGTLGWHLLDVSGAMPNWQYLPGQRRVKLAPEVSFDGPNFNLAGAGVIDECYMHTGGPNRYNWKLIGKKEMIIPYNNYRADYWMSSADVLGQKYFKSDAIRYEVHRVWVLEATLKPGARHIYKKRMLYLDEDSWYAHLVDQYDMQDKLWRVKTLLGTFDYDVQSGYWHNDTGVDLVAGYYFMFSHPDGGIRYLPTRPASQWTSQVLSGAGVR